MRGLLKFLLGLLMPVILIAAGAGGVAFGIEREWTWSVWTGLVLIGVGVLWGLILYFVADSGSFFD